MAQDGACSETLMFLGSLTSTDSLNFMGAAERPGTFRIAVAKAGYRAWCCSSPEWAESRKGFMRHA
ncbi:MAG TPA: hypothetical protein VFU23_12830 [Gemmatimonadales bacterium]|nr:hypothetical protein [Gemmatimonadales bacterium]